MKKNASSRSWRLGRRSAEHDLDDRNASGPRCVAIMQVIVLTIAFTDWWTR
jgi:hypothetical protein